MMTLSLATIADVVFVSAEADGFWLRPAPESEYRLDQRASWPPEALRAPGGLAVAIQIEQALEQGVAERAEGGIRIPYQAFAEAEDADLDLTSRWTAWSPLMLRIDRSSDVGRPDFRYRYNFVYGHNPVEVERVGYFVRHGASRKIWRLDQQSWALVEAMDQFNQLPEGHKTREESWLTFATVKGCAAEVGAALDDALRKNDVAVPSRLGLQMHVSSDGALSFAPRCEGVDDKQFRGAFFRNRNANGFYSIDVDRHRRVRVVLDQKLQEVVRRMQAVRNLRGEQKVSAEANPEQFFDGILDHVDIQYGERVIGVGDFPFTPGTRLTTAGTEISELLPKRLDVGGAVRPAVLHAEDPAGRPITIPLPDDASRKTLLDQVKKALERGQDTTVWGGQTICVDQDLVDALGSQPSTAEEPHRPHGKYLLIYTNEHSVDYGAAADGDGLPAGALPQFEPPRALAEGVQLQPHQTQGVHWLQVCRQMPNRRGVILADDMGLGKTLQILSFIAWCIDSGRFPHLERPPYRPVLIITPLILLENRTWEGEMKRFFRNGGAIFLPWVSLHGSELRKFRAQGQTGQEIGLGQPVLDLDRLQKHRVVLTNYETVKNYQHSFACQHDGAPMWSMVISDEAQEYKTPNAKISHAMKALAPAFHVACTGTPVENSLIDLWNISDTVNPGLLGSASDFRGEFAQPAASGDGATLVSLKQRLQYGAPTAYLLRRHKTALQGLPSKTVHRIECPMTEQEVTAHRSLTSGPGATSAHHFAILHALVRMSQHPAMLTGELESLDSSVLIAGSSKLQRVIRELHRIRGLNEKAILFCRHIAMQQALARVLSDEFGLNVLVINGKTQRSGGSSSFDSDSARKTRQQILEEFRSKKGFNLLILSPFVAGVGLTIVEANHVIHYGRWWNPAVESQATDRAYRIGQTKEVHVYLPILTDPSGTVSMSFDQALDALMQRKQRLAEDFLRPMEDEDTLGTELWNDLQRATHGAPAPLTMPDVDALSPFDFEALVAELFTREGRATVLTAKGNDGGADVITVNNGQFTVVQVKHSSCQSGPGLGALDDVLSAGNTYGMRLRLSPLQCIVTNGLPEKALLQECTQRDLPIIARDDLANLLEQFPITRADLAARARQRCKTFQEGIRKTEELLAR